MGVLGIILAAISLVLICVSIGLNIWATVLRKQSKKLWQQFDALMEELKESQNTHNECPDSNEGRNN